MLKACLVPLSDVTYIKEADVTDGTYIALCLRQIFAKAKAVGLGKVGSCWLA